jgi:hypothetical protein
MGANEQLTRVRDHCSKFFQGHEESTWTWELGPIRGMAPWFQVLRFAPGPRTQLWCYVSLGASLLSNRNSRRLEFILTTEKETPRAVELLAMIAHYHQHQTLGLFHSLPIGQPWLEGSTCEHFLISLPYPFGEQLEVCECGDTFIQILWLLPITKAEFDFKKARGVDALERLFEEAAIEYWRVDRESVV